MKELKIEKVVNGYIVIFLDCTGRKQIFKSYRKLSGFLRDYFEGEKKE